MKRSLLLLLALTLLTSAIFANNMIPGPQMKKAEIREMNRMAQAARPDTAIVTFSVNPFSLVFSYYDYMIGSYSDLPLCIQPDPLYGGFFGAFHGQNAANGTRRVYYTYIDDDGNVENLDTITSTQNREGYPGIAVDPVSGKPLYAWHANADADAELEIQFVNDAFLFGSAGIFSNPAEIIDNPVIMPPPYAADTDNEFIWPTVKIGPSPNTGMRRAYVLTRNAVTHTTYPSENVYIAYADFTADMLEAGDTLSWSYTSIPTMNDWNHDTTTWRRPFYAFTVGDDGRIYYVGYHIATILTPAEGDLVESDLDAFVCDNYGEGTWTRVTGSSVYPSWNPMLNYGDGPEYYFTGSDNLTPVPSDSLFWSISNSSHFNAVMDEDHNKINMAGIWAQQFRENTTGVLDSYFHPSLQVIRNLVYDVNAQTFSLREIYPVAGNSIDSLIALPWDEDGDGSVDEYYTNTDDPDDPSNGYPLLYSWWPFPHWNDAVAGDAMMFHYNNIKITPPNEEGMMAAVWQDSNRARLYNTYPTDYPELADFADTPEIYISVSPDWGDTWSEPTTLNKVETPELANVKPMWVYPADYIKFVGLTNGHKVGKLAILFYDDISWGSFQQDPPEGQNDGGYVKFMELEITFPFPWYAADDNVITPAVTMLKKNYPNPFNPETTISFNMPVNGTANLSIYNTKGQLVKTLLNDRIGTGDHKLVWKGMDNNGSPVASGLYFYKLKANGKNETRKMMLLK